MEVRAASCLFEYPTLALILVSRFAISVRCIERLFFRCTSLRGLAVLAHYCFCHCSCQDFVSHENQKDWKSAFCRYNELSSMLLIVDKKLKTRQMADVDQCSESSTKAIHSSLSLFWDLKGSSCFDPAITGLTNYGKGVPKPSVYCRTCRQHSNIFQTWQLIFAIFY